MKYDIFISYRRSSEKFVARVAKEALTRKGYSVFIDLDEIKDGHFMETIFEAIDNSSVFLVIMSQDYFANCSNENDHVRQELLYAIDHNKNIIPVVPNKDSVVFPDDIPAIIRNTISAQQYSYLDMDQLFEVSLEKLIKERLAPATKKYTMMTKKKHSLRWLLISVIFIVICSSFLFALYRNRPTDPDVFIEKADALSLAEEVSFPVRNISPKAERLYKRGAEDCERQAAIALDLFNQTRDTTHLLDARYYYHNAGYAWQSVADTRRAINNYSMAISCASSLSSSNNTEQLTLLVYSMNNLAYVYAEEGNYDNALETIDKAIMIDSTIINTFDSKGDILYMAGKNEDALEVWKLIQSKDPFYVKNPWVDKATAAMNGQ
ncbi:MAG: TIR domain-containing protein [Bacteroidales bacterium]|nr:TIR domain-containing protein [Bacteroidales bacterium]